MTETQEDRQTIRDRRGRYAEVPKCEDCGKPAGVNYYSAIEAIRTGKGLVLCKKCCTARDNKTRLTAANKELKALRRAAATAANAARRGQCARAAKILDQALADEAQEGQGGGR